MTTIKIEIETFDNTNQPIDEIEKALAFLLVDALAEFQFPRKDARAYVNFRYPEGKEYEWMDREKKIKEVQTRVRLAERLRCGALSAKTTIIKEP